VQHTAEVGLTTTVYLIIILLLLYILHGKDLSAPDVRGQPPVSDIDMHAEIRLRIPRRAFGADV